MGVVFEALSDVDLSHLLGFISSLCMEITRDLDVNTHLRVYNNTSVFNSPAKVTEDSMTSFGHCTKTVTQNGVVFFLYKKLT